MSIAFIDGFDHLQVPDLRNWKYANRVLLFGNTVLKGRHGSYCLDNGAGEGFRSFEGVTTSVTLGIAKEENFRDIGSLLFRVWGGLNDSTGVDIRTSDYGEVFLNIVSGDNAGEEYYSEPGLYGIGGYNYFEAKYTFGRTDGAVEVRVNGVTVLNVSGIDTTKSGDITEFIGFGWSIVGAQEVEQRIDDFYCITDDGISHTSFLGDVRVDTLFPSVDISVNFTPKTSPVNSDQVNEQLADGDTSVVESGSLNAKDIYSYDDLVDIGHDNIYGVQHGLISRKNSPDTILAGSIVVLNDQEFQSPDFTILDDYFFVYDEVWEENLQSGLQWTEEDINSIQAGYKIVSIA